MKEISLHILDILQNSIAANATLVELYIEENIKKDIFMFYVKDNGKGMDEEFLKNVTSPFTTKRKTRKVGLGIPLLKLAAEKTGGELKIESEVGKGTKTEAVFKYSSIDRQPLGNIADTFYTVVESYLDVEFLYTHIVNNEKFVFDTREIKKILNGVSLNEPEVSSWISEYLKEGEENLEEIKHREV